MEQSTNPINSEELQKEQANESMSAANLTEHAIKQSADELLKWLSGTNTYFIRSMKALEKQSKEPDALRSYITQRLFEDLSRMSEIAEIYARPEEDQYGPDGKKLRKEHHPRIDVKELERFYHTMIAKIVIANKDTLDEMRMKVDALKLVSKNPDEFGKMLFNYMFYRITESQTMPIKMQTGYLLCLILAVTFHPYEEMGKYADDIKEILTDFSTGVCMVINKDYKDSVKPQKKEQTKHDKANKPGNGAQE